MVYVKWLDSGMHLDFDRGWRDTETYVQKAAIDNMVVETVGFLMHEDVDILLVGQSHDRTGDNWVGAQVIARRNVIVKRDLVDRDAIVEELVA